MLPVLTAALILAGSTASATVEPDKSASATAEAVAALDKDDDKVICRRVTPIGSRLGGERVCKRKSEWDVRRRDDQEAATRQQIRGLQGNSGGGG